MTNLNASQVQIKNFLQNPILTALFNLILSLRFIGDKNVSLN
jgi:hypothetical protein